MELDKTIFMEEATEECIDPRSDIFIQYTCEESRDQSNIKFQRLSMVACISCFISLLFSITIYYLKAKAFIDIKTFDLATVTAADYTVYLPLEQT